MLCLLGFIKPSGGGRIEDNEPLGGQLDGDDHIPADAPSAEYYYHYYLDDTEPRPRSVRNLRPGSTANAPEDTRA